MNKIPELSELSPEQRRVAETFGRGLAVLAGAGSGKTTTLVVKCAELLRRKPDARFAAVSFTERSASDLRAKLSEGLSGELSGHWIMTIHGLCAAIIGEYPREAGYDGDERMLSEGETAVLWEQACEGLWFDELPEPVENAVAALLQRESRDGVERLLGRGRELASFGALESLDRSGSPAASALAAVARHVLERFDRMKRRRGAMDFNDLEAGADRALEHQAVRQAFNRRFDLVLVDEFQDTNPLQARLISRFCRPDLSNLCVVGDPKQSIYRFRDADVGVFDDFCRQLGEPLSLTWNFRSRPGIIDYANRVCAPAFEASGMAYEALEARREAAPGTQPVCRLDVREPSGLAAFLNSERDRGVPLEKMALLVRRIRGNEAWFRALTAAGIPIALGSGGLFWEDPRVRECVAFLKWWENPANIASGATFFRAPWTGLADSELDRWISQDRTLVTPFFSSAHALARELAPLRGAPVRPGELLMKLLVSDEVEAELGSAVMGLWHRCEELSSRGLGMREVTLELARAVESSRRERDVPPPRNQGQLQVLTLHSAKGLEFEHVILIDLGNKPRTQPAPLLFWDRERGAWLSPRDSDGERNKKDPVEMDWRELEKKKNFAESKRLFYVALTRARERLILVCPELDEASLSKISPENAYQEDWWRAWVECVGALEPVLDVEKIPGERGLSRTVHERIATRTPGAVRVPVPLYRPRHAVTEWTLLARCPRAYEWRHVRLVKLGASAADGEGGSSPELGTEVHACLEKGDWERLRRIERERGSDVFRAEPLIDWARSSPLMNNDSAAWTELSFEIPIRDSEALVGTFDRVVRAPGLHLVDFKVTRADANSLLASYGTQMELYAASLATLAPRESAAGISATLVAIAPSGVREVKIPDSSISSAGKTLERLADASRAICSGQAGAPTPGSHCRYCEFKAGCDVAQYST